MSQDNQKVKSGDRGNKFYDLPFKIERFKDMPFRFLGSSGLKVPNIGLGTWKIGYPERGDGSRVGEKEAFKLFDQAIESGVNFWDTANRYNNASGNSERVIVNWLAGNPDQRRNVLLATKLGGTMDGITPNHCGLSRANILDSVYASLERLRTSYIDVLYFHLFDPLIPPEESLAAIEDLVRRDLVRYFAVSNFTVAQLKIYQQIQKDRTLRSRIVAVQNQFDILNGERAPYDGVLDYAGREGISFISWSPLAKGLLTGRYADSKNIGSGDRLFDEGELKAGSAIPHISKLQQLMALSKEWGMNLNQLVISYMLTLQGMGPIIASSSSVAQLISNAEAGKINLSEDQKKQIGKIITQLS